MILAGCDTDGERGFDCWEENLNFALKIQDLSLIHICIRNTSCPLGHQADIVAQHNGSEIRGDKDRTVPCLDCHLRHSACSAIVWVQGPSYPFLCQPKLCLYPRCV